MNSLRNIHAALVRGGLLIDTQPVSARPAVEASAGRLGTLDMREWARLIEEVDQRVQQTVDAGMWASRGDHHFVVADTFESGSELSETVSGWQGTRIPARLSRRLAAAPGPLRVDQRVRLRVLEAL